MVCKRCGHQNDLGAKYCCRCGRRLARKRDPGRKLTWFTALCVLIIGIGIGILIPRGGAFEKEQGIDNHMKVDTVRETVPQKATENNRTSFNENHDEKSEVVTEESTRKKEALIICQVIPMEDGSVAVLYENGTVRVSGNTDFSEVVSNWESVKQLYYTRCCAVSAYEPILAGLTESGRVLTTEGNIPGWKKVNKLNLSIEGIVGITENGNALTFGIWEDDTTRSTLNGLSNVEDLIYSDILETWGCLKKDGNVHLIGEYTDPKEVYWNNVKEVRHANHGFYVMKKDGTVDGSLESSYEGLDNAVKVIDYNDWLFGISADGRLLTHNNGNIYTNTGEIMVDAPGSMNYAGEVDIRQFNNIIDIVCCQGIILLNENGTAEHIGLYPHWDLSEWNNVQKICGSYSNEGKIYLYGLQQDGSVVLNQYDVSKDTYMISSQYRGWILQDIYVGEKGIVGLTADRKLVGDGIYENVDFSVFE